MSLFLVLLVVLGQYSRVCVCARVVALLQPRVSRAVWDGGERGVHFRYKKGRESGRKEGGEEGSHLVHLSA